ncbi:MAG TPA: GAF domain-containing protein, partial [Planctomycetota bacterium]|nr:GAF domain-containing protein [Planctomycetota bacterium]
MGPTFPQDYQRLRLTNSIISEMSKGSRIDDILDVIYRELKERVPFDRIAIAMIDRDRQELTVTALKTEGEVHLPVGHLQPVGDMRLQAVVGQGETKLIGDLHEFLREHPESDSTRRLIREGMRSNLAIPLRIGDEIIGIMSASSRIAEAFAAEHVRALSEISGHVAVAADKAQLIARLSDRTRRLEQANKELQEANELKGTFLKKVSEEVDRQTAQLQRASERERRLLRISGTVNSSLDLQAVFRVAVGELRDVVRFDRASITLVDDAGLHLRFAALEPPQREILG